MKHVDVLHWTPTDYLSDYKTRRLDLNEHGAYHLLLWHMWNDSESQCDFPLDYAALASIWGVCPEEAERTIESLTAPGVALVQVRTVKSETLLTSKRLREQKKAAEAFRKKQSDKGVRSGAVRRANAANHCSTTVQPLLNQTEPTYSRIHVSRKPEDQTPVPSTSTGQERKERTREIHSDDPSPAIAVMEGKLERVLNADELASVRRWVKTYGIEATRTGIGYAFQDGFGHDLARTHGQIRALAGGAS